MKKFIFIMLIIICFSQVINSQEMAKIDANLQEEMALRKSGEKIRINIILNAQYDQMEMRSKANVFQTRAAKRAFVIDELKRFANETQRDLMLSLAGWSKSSLVSDIRPLWIANSINCYANADVITELSTRSDVMVIGYDKEEYMLFDGETPTNAESGKGREITYNILKVRANEVWDLGYTGEGIIVAVIDTGVKYTHNDLAGNMWEDPDYPNHGYNVNGNNNNPMDDHGHGSHCAGTVAGTGASGSKTGAAPSAKIMAVKVLNYQGNGTVAQMCDGVQFAVDHGANVLSMSIGKAGGGTNSERIQYRNTMINALEAGIVAAVAAGNEGTYPSIYTYPVPNNVRLPGNCPPPWLHPDQTVVGGLTSVVAIGATDSYDGMASFSSHGPTTWQNIAGFDDYPYSPGIGLIRPDVCAPGVNIKSLNYASNTGYTTMDGTSMATPCVAGVMALMLSKNPDLTPAEICEILETTAVSLSPTKSNLSGSGRIDAFEAINAIVVENIKFENVAINDSEANNNGRLNPGETVNLNISMKNESATAINAVNVVLTSNDENVTIVQNSADFGNFSGNETKTVTNAFTITLSEEAAAKSEIPFSLKATSETGESLSKFSLIVFDYQLNISSVVIPENGTLAAGVTSDIWIYLENIGNEDAPPLTGEIIPDDPYLMINDTFAFYGPLSFDHYKYRVYNIAISPSTPQDITKQAFIMNFTDGSRKETTLHGNLNFNNSGTMPQICNDDLQLSSSVNGSSVTLTWIAPAGKTPESYNVYRDNEFLLATTEKTYTQNDLLDGKYQYCIEASYSDGCTSYLFCKEVIITCGIPQSLTAQQTSETQIHLSWSAPNSEDLVYNIYKNSELIVKKAETTTYDDLEVEPLVNYCYAVKSLCYGDLESNPSNEVCIEMVGIKEIANNVKIYPNPANSAIFVEGEGFKTIAIYNTLGQMIETIDVTGDKTTINTTHYQPAVYFVEITTKEGSSISRRFVISH